MGKICERCGHDMPDGALAYEVRIQVAADFDGVLPDEADAGELDCRMAALVEEMNGMDPDRLLHDVYHVERHRLCPGCRDRYLANPLNLPLPESLG